jgi:molecular chaperone DnaK (HSP70)
LVGGGAQSPAVQQIAAEIFGLPLVVPKPGKYVADGAAHQAAAVLAGSWPSRTPDGCEVTTPAGAVPALCTGLCQVETSDADQIGTNHYRQRSYYMPGLAVILALTDPGHTKGRLPQWQAPSFNT